MKTIIHKSFSKGVDTEKKLVRHINNSLTDDDDDDDDGSDESDEE